MCERVAQGDLSSIVSRHHRGEIGRLFDAMALMQERLDVAVRSIVHSTGSIAAASRQIAAGSMDLHDRTEAGGGAGADGGQRGADHRHRQAERRPCARSERAGGQSAQLARQGSEETQHAIDAMREISQSSQRIDEIIRLIDEIAFQTNILALNAAVERRARRAGASPWWRAKRALAQRSATAAKSGPDRGVLRFGGARQPARGTGQRHHGQRAGIGPQQRAADGRDRHGLGRAERGHRADQSGRHAPGQRDAAERPRWWRSSPRRPPRCTTRLTTGPRRVGVQAVCSLLGEHWTTLMARCSRALSSRLALVMGGRSSSVIKPCKASARLIGAGLGSANNSRIRPRSFEQLARRFGVAVARQLHDLDVALGIQVRRGGIAASSHLEVIQEGQVLAAQDVHPARASSADNSEGLHSLTGAELRQRGQRFHGLNRHRNARALGDVVQDDGAFGGPGDLAVVPQDALLRRAQ